MQVCITKYVLSCGRDDFVVVVLKSFNPPYQTYNLSLYITSSITKLEIYLNNLKYLSLRNVGEGTEFLQNSKTLYNKEKLYKNVGGLKGNCQKNFISFVY